MSKCPPSATFGFISRFWRWGGVRGRDPIGFHFPAWPRPSPTQAGDSVSLLCCPPQVAPNSGTPPAEELRPPAEELRPPAEELNGGGRGRGPQLPQVLQVSQVPQVLQVSQVPQVQVP